MWIQLQARDCDVQIQVTRHVMIYPSIPFYGGGDSRTSQCSIFLETCPRVGHGVCSCILAQLRHLFPSTSIIVRWVELVVRRSARSLD